MSAGEAPAGARRWRTGTAPGRLPVLGHTIPLARRPLQFLESLRAHGDLVEFRLGPRPAYLACAPSLVHEVLRDSRTYDKGGPLFEKARSFTGDGLFTSGWAEHRRQRRLVQPAFHAERIDSYASIMCEEIETVLGSWRPGHAVDVSSALHALTARVTTRTLFSAHIADADVDEAEGCLPVLMRGVYRHMISPLPGLDRLPTPENRRFERARARLRRIIDRTVAEYRTAGVDHGDLLSILLSTRDEETGESLTDREVHDQVMTLFLGGVETTAITLAWAFHVLGTHPAVEERLHSEVDEVLSGRPPRVGDLPRLDYTRRVITEVLRLYPPGWIFTRETSRATELAGRLLPPGTIVLYSPYVLGRDPGSFPSPLDFDPDRWLPGRAGAVPRGAMAPFGGGARKCIGDTFGMTEATLALVAVAARWRLRPLPGAGPVHPKPKIGLVTGRLPLIPEPRC